MYVCLCNKVTDKQIQRAIRKGAADTIMDIMEQLDVGNNCGSCLEHAVQVIDETKAEMRELNYDLAVSAA